MKKKRIVTFVTCIVLVLAILTSAYVFVTNYKASLVIRCNENEITQGLYTMYMVTEAAQMDRTQYESDVAFLEELEKMVLDRICIDTYYATMCRQEGYTLTKAEAAAVEVKALAEMIQLGFDDTQYSNNDAYLEYFNVTKADFLEFYTRKALYDKYFLAMSGQTQDVFNDLMSEYQKFTERQKAQEKILSYWENISVLNTNVTKYFNEHRYEYATNYIDVVFMRYPTDESGLVVEEVKEEYAQIAEQAYVDLHMGGENGGLYIHQFKTEEPYKDYVTSAGKMYVDSSNVALDVWGEEFIKTCLEGETNRTYRVYADCGIAVFKVLSIEGEEGYWDQMALTIKTKDIGNKVRKAILQDEYEPVILNEVLYNQLQNPSGDFWQNLLEK